MTLTTTTTPSTTTCGGEESSPLLSRRDTNPVGEREEEGNGGCLMETCTRTKTTTANVLKSLQRFFSEDASKKPPTASNGASSSSPTSTKTLDEKTSPLLSNLYGLISAAIVIPISASFAHIIFRDEFFRPYMPKLVNLTIFSGVVHQLTLSTFSSLPFAVGQVQDAGLIFLSAMASNMVAYCRAMDNDAPADEEILATVTIGLGLFTAMLGLGLLCIGKCKLGSVVQALPTPVVGGYLAYIGYFCGQSGLELMVSTSSNSVYVAHLWEWNRFFETWEQLRLLLPGVFFGILLYFLVRTIRHMAVLPVGIATILILFYGLLFLTGNSIESARNEGWISAAEPSIVWYETWDYFKFDKVIWSALPPNILTVLSMTLVVALSSSLDVAAIELEVGHSLDYNHELRTLGLSNVLSGLTGGYTGSYIFSVSIFSLRAGIRSRLAGYFLSFVECVSIVIPVAILSFLPNYFFGALLIFISMDLLYEWLWSVRSKVTSVQYVEVLATFGFLQLMRIEIGIFCGILLHLVLHNVLGFSTPSTTTPQEETTDATESA